MAGGSSPGAYLRMTYDRFSRFMPRENILVVTLAKYAATARILLPEIPEKNLLLEPFGRKTAPCMAFATYTILTRDPDALIVASPCDLVIRDDDMFAATIDEMFGFVSGNDVLMTLGIVPRSPDVNFGYIQVKEGRGAWEMEQPLQVKTFTEKPPLELAEVFIRTGEFFWNSGIFLWKASVIREEMELPSSARKWNVTSPTSPNCSPAGKPGSAIPPSSNVPTPNARRSPSTTASWNAPTAPGSTPPNSAGPTSTAYKPKLKNFKQLRAGLPARFSLKKSRLFSIYS